MLLESLCLSFRLSREVASRPVRLHYQRVIRTLVVSVLLKLDENSAQIVEAALVVSEPRAHLVRGEAQVGIHH